jgi:allantoinase
MIIRAERVLTPDGFREAAVRVDGGVITAVTAFDEAADADVEITLPTDQVLLPGLVDTHVHVNEPGRTEWEGFATATRAAAAGGVTTLIDMPLNSIPPTTTPAALAVKQASAGPQAMINVGFWGGAIPASLGHLKELHDLGVFGFKCFLAPSGVDEFPHLDGDQLLAALGEVAAFDGLLIVHAEDPTVLDASANAGGVDYETFVASRPPQAENAAIAAVLDGVRRTGARAHILHLSSASALPMIAAAKAEGLPITVETCPHYLTLDAEHVPDGGTQFKCCPPIRDHGNQDALWAGLLDGTIDLVASDHSPCTIELKRAHGGDFGQAWGGIAAVQLSVSALWTAARDRGIPLETVVGWMTTQSTALVGLPHKGRIAVGADADLVAFAPGDVFVVDPAELLHRNPISPYAGLTLQGRARCTWIGGVLVEPESPGSVLPGQLLTRP